MVALACAVLAVVLIWTIARLWAKRSKIAELLARTETLCGEPISGPLPLRMARAIEALLERLNAQEHRTQLVHSVTGLPTREPLAMRMAADGAGTLAILACKDYDRLCVFDADLAEHVLQTMADRIAAMLPASHLLAQVDRSHLAVWIGAELPRAHAEAEIDALCYALSERIIDGEREILPEIVARKARFDAAQGVAQATISQTLSTFSLPGMGSTPASVVDAEIGPQAREHFQVEQDLRQAVARNQLRMLYQPLVDAARHRVCGAEALLRWEHDQRGLVQPSRFLPIAEAAGLSHEIGLWVLNRACRDARLWLAELAGVRVAVNVSGHQLEAEDLALLVGRTLERHGLPGTCLEIELTESVALADDVQSRILCDELRRLGVSMAIDDFGTGYSSLGSLRNLAFDKIKIDRTFVTDVHKLRDSQAICSSLIDLGRGLGIKVLAEGVETADEYRWLRACGCTLFQGFYFAPPLESRDFLEFARDPLLLTSLITPNRASHLERLRA